MVGGKTGLRSIGTQINDTRSFVCSLTMGKTPNFIENESVVAENHHFFDSDVSDVDLDLEERCGADHPGSRSGSENFRKSAPG